VIDWLRADPHEVPRVTVGGLHLPVVVRRHANARRMTLRLSPDGREVRITIPHWGRTTEALAFASARHDWLASQLAAIPRAAPIGDGASIPFRGELLAIRHDPAASRRPALLAGQIVLGGPASALQARLRRWLEAQARMLIAPDLAHYCARAGKEPPPLALSGAKRRWGSCAPDGSIRINWRLVMAPDFVRRSVVAHEVAHLIHFDHSPRFHALLAQLFEDDVAEANAWLKREGRALYQPFG
jgi:predicted metal-dependent hydrolase